MKMKKLLACLMAVAMLASLQIFVSAVEGTPITTAEELASIGTTGEYYLANDILITGEWTSPANFAGTLDGNGKSVVFSGARVYGGLFNSLNGATVKNLMLVDGSGDGHKANDWICNALDTGDAFVAPLADCAWGTIENVATRIDIGTPAVVGSDMVGGIVGCQYGGNLTMSGCVNMTDVTSKAHAGGMLSTVCVSGAAYELSIQRCVNYGHIYAQKTAGGMLGHNGDAYGNTKITVDQCINYGKIENDGGDQASGMVGFVKPTAEGTIIVTNNINYGEVAGAEGAGGQYSGIITRMNLSGETATAAATIKNNLNYGNIQALGDTAQAAGIVVHCGTPAKITASDNYSVLVTTKKEVSADLLAMSSLLGTGAFTALNTAAPNTFVDGTPIALAWAQTAGVTDTAPTLPAPTVDYSGVVELDEYVDDEGDEDYSDDEDEDEGKSEETEAASADETEATEEKKGCGSAIGGAVSAIAVIGLAAAVVGKKKKSDG